MSDEDVHGRMVRLAQRLLEQTTAGNISWSLTDSEDQYLYSGSSSSVVIWQRQSDYYQLALLSPRGTVVETLASAAPAFGPSQLELQELLERLFHSARRMAQRTESLLDSVMRDVDFGYKHDQHRGDDDPPF